jgi:HPt (histidine-containing phosphotransfer) domain-containing protein
VRDDRAQDGTERFTVDTMVRPLDNDEEIAREIAGVFIESSTELLAELSHAATDGNGDMVRSRVHCIKGSAGNIGATALQHLAAEIEEAGKDGDPATVTRLLPQLEAELARVFAALEAWSAL